MAISLYEKYGGFAKINRVVLAFYDAILDSDLIGDFFDGTDMSALIDHQTKFVSYLLGGPFSFEEERLVAAHGNLGISDREFDEMKKIFAKTLSDFDFEPQDIDTVTREIENRRALVTA